MNGKRTCVCVFGAVFESCPYFAYAFFTTYLYWNSKADLNFKEINNQFRDLFNWLTPQADLPAQLGVSLLMRTQHALYGQLDVGGPPVSLHPTFI